ncbi:MAG TPA: glycyl-radical enzyme activating protein [Bacteroidales bacterium]|nr:glycyl-radical enzyme activating protein [Bacteroidales bacterium]
MTGIVFDIKRFAIHDGPGIRTSIFFKGCPLSCWWCHNPESKKSDVENLTSKFKGRYFIGWNTTAQELLKEVEKDSAFYKQSNGGITFTGGEPLMQAAFLSESAQLFKSQGFHLCLDTSGYAAPEIFKELSEYFDLFLFDLKLIDDQEHQKYTGVSNKNILKNLEYLVEKNKNIQIRFPLIPNINDQTAQLEKVSHYLSGLHRIKNIDLLPYHKIATGKYEQLKLANKMEKTKEADEEKIENVKLFFEKKGFQVKIGG